MEQHRIEIVIEGDFSPERIESIADNVAWGIDEILWENEFPKPFKISVNGELRAEFEGE